MVLIVVSRKTLLLAVRREQTSRGNHPCKPGSNRMVQELFRLNQYNSLDSASLRLVVRQGNSPCSAVAAQNEADFISFFLTYI